MEFTDIHEDELNEFKKEWVDKALEDIAAFANSQGGTLWIGVNDVGEIEGCDCSDKEYRKITSKITNVLGIRPTTERIKKEKKCILRINVEKSNSLVHMPSKGYLCRVGSANVQMPQFQVIEMMLKMTGQTWDSLSSGWDLEKVNEDQVALFLRLAREGGRLTQTEASTDVARILANLNLIKEDKLTNAAVLLFGKKPQDLFPQSEIQIVRIQGSSIRDSRIFQGTLWGQLEGALGYLRELLGVRFDVNVDDASLEGFQRQENWAYPQEALREALLNALVHRDYTISAPITIRVQDSQLQIFSPGSLPEEIKIEDLYKEDHLSVRRNILISEIFYQAKLVERWGSGTTRMLVAFAEQGLPRPDFKEHNREVNITFYQDRFTVDRLEGMELSDRQIKGVQYVKERRKITNKEYRELVNISDEAALQDIKDMIEKDILIRRGKGRGTHYVLVGD